MRHVLKNPIKRQQGSALFAFTLIASSVLAGGLAIGLSTWKSQAERYERLTIGQEAAAMREFSEAAASAMQAVAGSSDINFCSGESGSSSTTLSPITLTASCLSSTTCLNDRATWVPQAGSQALNLFTSAPLRSDFSDPMASGSSIRAYISRSCTGASLSSASDLLVTLQKGESDGKTPTGRDSAAHRNAARLSVAETLRREPPQLGSGSTAERGIIGFVDGNRAVLATQGESISLTHVLPQSSRTASNQQPAVFIKAPAQWGYWLLSVSSKTKAAPQDCSATATGSPVFYKCPHGITVTNTASLTAIPRCSLEEATCLRRSTEGEEDYAACATRLGLASTQRNFFCSAVPFCSREEMEAAWASNTAAKNFCIVRTSQICTDGSQRRLELLPMEPQISNLGFSFVCPAGAENINSTWLSAASSNGARRWSTNQDNDPVKTFCVRAYRHQVPSTNLSNTAWKSLVPLHLKIQDMTDGQARLRTLVWNDASNPTLRSGAADEVIEDEYLRSAAANQTRTSRIVADWTAGPNPDPGIYPREGINACVGPYGEEPAATTGPSESNIQIPNAVMARMLAVKTTDGAGHWVLYSLASRFITNNDTTADLRSYRVFNDWMIAGTANATLDSYQSQRASMLRFFENNQRINGYAEIGVTYIPSSTSPSLVIDIPYNAAGLPLTVDPTITGATPYQRELSASETTAAGGVSCENIRGDVYGSALPRSHRAEDTTPSPCRIPTRLGPPWRITLKPVIGTE